MNKIITISLLFLTLISCQKKIEISLPDVVQDTVLEGRIEIGLPPLVILTKTQGYFDPTSADAIFNTFIHGADVKMTVNGTTYTLTEFCSTSIPDSLLADVSALTGVPIENLTAFDYCVYTNFTIFGQENTSYQLDVITSEDTLSAITHIPGIVPLTNTWFQPQPNLDSLGFIWATLQDPDSAGNCYRWYAQRINRYDYEYPGYPGGPYLGKIKDPFPIAPFGSVIDDRFFDGLSFDFQYNRGEIGNLEGPDDEGPEEGYFKSGDTVLVKFTSIDYLTYLHIRALENQAATNGSPFASPGNLPTNVKGGIGIWAGFAPYYDTVVCN